MKINLELTFTDIDGNIVGSEYSGVICDENHQPVKKDGEMIVIKTNVGTPPLTLKQLICECLMRQYKSIDTPEKAITADESYENYALLTKINPAEGELDLKTSDVSKILELVKAHERRPQILGPVIEHLDAETD